MDVLDTSALASAQSTASDVHYAASGSLPTLTNEQIADRLLYGSWNAHGGNGWVMDIDLDLGRNPARTVYVNLVDLNNEGKWLANAALDAWEATTGIHFSTATPPSGQSVQIWIDDAGSSATTSNSYRSGPYELVSSRIHIPQDRIDGNNNTLDAFVFRNFVHELGHALGLGHPADYDSGDDFEQDATFANDSWQTSIMSYYSQTENTLVDASKAYQLTPMAADFLALREAYGATGALRSGDTVYGVGSTAGDFYDRLEEYWETMAFTIVDDGGIDTIDFSETTSGQVVNLAAEAFSSVGGKTGNMVIGAGTVIENFHSGDGDDQIVGNSAANRIKGGGGTDLIEGAAGNDSLLGGGGADTLLGGAGKDRLEGGNGADRLVGGKGKDKLFGGNQADVLKGDGHKDVLKGGNGADVLKGGAGEDKLEGGKGTDTLEGGDDADTLLGGDDNDVLCGDGGKDSLSGDNGKDLLKGGAGSDTLRGGRGADVLKGQAGDDALFGGKGDDVMNGGDGADTFQFTTVGGHDRVADWEDGIDVLDLSDWEIGSFKDLKALASTVSKGVVLNFGVDDSLTVQGLSLADLSADDVLLAIV